LLATAFYISVTLFMAMPKFPHCAAFLAVCIALLAPACRKQKPPPSIDGLSDALERSAVKSLPDPSLANEQLVIRVKPGQSNSLTPDILAAATAAGGVAIPSHDSQGHASILATVPLNNVDAFKAAVRHEKSTMLTPASQTQLIEVVIDDTPPSTPSPSP
jgi:hypothetical protein